MKTDVENRPVVTKLIEMKTMKYLIK